MDQLSNEVIEHIFTYLACADIDACRLACQRFRNAIQGSILLRYMYRLQLSGRNDPDVHSVKLSVATRLSALQSLEDAWIRADFTPLPNVTLPMSAISGTISAHESLYLLPKLYGRYDRAYEKVMRLSAAPVTDPAGRWQELDLTGQPANGELRVAQEIFVLAECDLLVIFSIEGVGSQVNRLVFDLYTANTFEPHPDAARPSIVIHCPASLQLIIEEGNLFEYLPARIAVSGEFILFEVTDWASESVSDEGIWSREHLFYCIQWRDGSLMALGLTRCFTSIIEMQFITHDTLLIARGDEGQCLELCAITKCPDRGWVMQTILILRIPGLGPSAFAGNNGVILLDDSGSVSTAVSPVKQPPLLSTSMSTSVCVVKLELEQRDVAGDFRFRSYILIMRCASLLKLVDEAPPEGRFTWSQPTRPYLYMDGELPGAPVPQSTPADTMACTAPILDVDEWSKIGVLWLDCDDDEARGRYSWIVCGQHLVGSSSTMERTGPHLPLCIFHFNPYDIDRVRALAQSASETLPQDEGLEPASRDTVHDSAEGDGSPFDTLFGPWRELPNGNEVAVVDRPPIIPAGEWWGEDLVSNLPFAVTRTARADRWPMFTVHEDIILRREDKNEPEDGVENTADSAGTCFEVFRLGSGWVSK